MCVFCEIVEGRRPARVVYADEICVAFLDADPIQEGHVLLIPRMHCLDADDMPEDVFMHVMRVSRMLIVALKRAFVPDGYSIMQNGGAFNDIGHYHMHIFPRKLGDGFGWTAPDEHFDVSEKIARKIRSHR